MNIKYIEKAIRVNNQDIQDIDKLLSTDYYTNFPKYGFRRYILFKTNKYLRKFLRDGSPFESMEKLAEEIATVSFDDNSGISTIKKHLVALSGIEIQKHALNSTNIDGIS